MPGSARTRAFDPVLVGNRETDAWAAYYLPRHHDTPLTR